MKRRSFALGVALCVAPLAAHAQYGIVENFDGVGRLGWAQDCYEGPSGEFAGGGAVLTKVLQTPGVGVDGTRGLELAGSVNGGWVGWAMATDEDVAANGGVDITQVVNGLATTHYTVTFKDVQNDGDTFDLRVESGAYNRSETFTIGPLDGTLQTFQFPVGTGRLSTEGGAFELTNITNMVVLPASDNGSFEFIVDDVGFAGDLVPDNPVVDDFDSYPVGSILDDLSLDAANDFGGNTFAFEYGSAITAADILDVSGIKGLRLAMDGTMCGFSMELGPHAGSQADFGDYDALTLDIAVGSPGDTVLVVLETIDAAEFADRCSMEIAPGGLLGEVRIPFSELQCGPQGFDPSRLHRISFFPGNDNGDGMAIMIDTVRFTSTPGSAVAEWETLE